MTRQGREAGDRSAAGFPQPVIAHENPSHGHLRCHVCRAWVWHTWGSWRRWRRSRVWMCAGCAYDLNLTNTIKENQA